MTPSTRASHGCGGSRDARSCSCSPTATTRQAAPISAIRLESEASDGARNRSRADRPLKRLAEETGGGYFELTKGDELAATFTRVAQELHSEYTLGFSPATLDGKKHKLTVRMNQAVMNARARKSYVASPEHLTMTE